IYIDDEENTTRWFLPKKAPREGDGGNRVPFLVRKIEEEEPEDDGKRDSLSEAVKIHWTAKGESEEEWNPSIEDLDETLVLNSTEARKKVSESTIVESVSLYSYVPEPEPELEPEPEPEPKEEEKPKKKKDRKKRMEEPQEETEMELEPEPELEVEPESIEMQREKSDLESEWTANLETESVPEWEPKSATELDHGDEASNFSEDGESGEVVVETEEINIQMVDPPKWDETDEEDENVPSYTWLLGPTSDEVILDVVDFFFYILSFVQNPIGFGNRTRECCKKGKHYPASSGDDSDKE
ncbi:hypothetical protein J437_LFUL004908, partial [Ladona fulva]